MYQGKFHGRPGVFSSRRNLLGILSTVAVMLALLVYAVRVTEVPEKNLCRYEGRGRRIQEEFDGVRRTNVAITNTGDTDTFFRAAVIITWRDGEGNLSREIPAEGTDYEIVYGDGWISAGGYYYWQGAVAPGKTTGNLIESCTPLQEKTSEAGVYTLSVEVLADAVQCFPGSAAKAWGDRAAVLVGAD